MSIITTQSKLIANNRAIKILKGGRFYLIYLVFCIASKQVVKMLQGRKLHLAYFVTQTVI